MKKIFSNYTMKLILVSGCVYVVVISKKIDSQPGAS